LLTRETFPKPGAVHASSDHMTLGGRNLLCLTEEIRVLKRGPRKYERCSNCLIISSFEIWLCLGFS
jgi:hypothetical protein